MPGLADAMAHVLAKKPKVQGGPILARSKSTIKRLQEERKEQRERRKGKEQHKQEAEKYRLLAAAYPLDVEKKLVRIATRGTVSLFNAVRKQQKGEDEKKSEKVQAMSKASFLDLLKGSGKKEGEVDSKKEAPSRKSKESDKGSGWSVLSDDYMMGASMRKWKEKGEGEGESGGEDEQEMQEQVSDWDSDEEMYEGESDEAEEEMESESD